MTKTIRIEVTSIKEAAEFFGKMHMEYMEMLMRETGHFHKTENWELSNGKGFAEVIISKE